MHTEHDTERKRSGLEDGSKKLEMMKHNGAAICMYGFIRISYHQQLLAAT